MPRFHSKNPCPAVVRCAELFSAGYNLNYGKKINVSKFYYSKIIILGQANNGSKLGLYDGMIHEQTCDVCTTNDIGDEYHYLFPGDF